MDIIDEMEQAAEGLLGDLKDKAAADTQAAKEQQLSGAKSDLESLAARLGFETVEDAQAAERDARQKDMADRIDDLIQLRGVAAGVAKDPIEELDLSRQLAGELKSFKDYIAAAPAKQDLEKRKSAAEAEVLEARRGVARGQRDGWLLHDDADRAQERLKSAYDTLLGVSQEHEAATDARRAGALVEEYGKLLLNEHSF